MVPKASASGGLGLVALAAPSVCRDAHERDADPWVVRDETDAADRALCDPARRGVSGFLDVRHGVLVWQGGL